ncbi:MAG: hypothetical protein KDK66_06580 [Deltaproteobacteria bacterium]|nr:hypothetical protein [Deltaproteobacteria bacterium]
MSNSLKALDRPALFDFFEKMEVALAKQKKFSEVTLLGGTSLIILGIRDRVTWDVDILPAGKNIELFLKLAIKLKMPVDVVSLTSKIDLAASPKTLVYQGKYLQISSIGAEALLQSKLERYAKQDPEDLIALSKKMELSYKKFLVIFKEMIIDYVGNPDRFLIQVRDFVELVFPENLEDFYNCYPMSFE